MQPATRTSGTPPAFDSLFEQHVARVWRTLRRLGVADADVDDCTQEVFVVIHRQLSGFEGRSSIETWIYGICLRVAAKHRRSARVRREVLVGEVCEDTFDADQEDSVQRAQARAVLDEVLAELDDDKRRVFVLHDLEELGMKEVAELEQCPVQTGYYRLHAARAFVEGAITEHAEREHGVLAARRDTMGRARRQRVAAGVTAVTGASLLGSGARAEPPAESAPTPPTKLAFITAPKWFGLGTAVVVGLAALALLRPRMPTAYLARPAVAGVDSPNTVSVQPAAVPPAALPPAAVPRENVAVPAVVPPPQPAVVGTKVAVRARATTPSSEASAAPPAASPASELAEPLPSEGALLSSAQAALSTDPAEAYRLTERHTTLFGASSPLSQEREMIAIEALVALDRRDEAESRAALFVTHHPRSSHARRLRSRFEPPRDSVRNVTTLP